MSMISEALDYLYETIHAEDVAGEWVTLTVGLDSTLLLATLEKAKVVPPSLLGFTPGGFDFATSNPKNIDHDFSILAADYAINGVSITPTNSHEIKRVFGGTTQVYQVMASDGTGAVWEWQDGYDKRYLVHTKFVRTE